MKLKAVFLLFLSIFINLQLFSSEVQKFKIYPDYIETTQEEASDPKLNDKVAKELSQIMASGFINKDQKLQKLTQNNRIKSKDLTEFEQALANKFNEILKNIVSRLYVSQFANIQSIVKMHLKITKRQGASVRQDLSPTRWIAASLEVRLRNIDIQGNPLFSPDRDGGRQWMMPSISYVPDFDIAMKFTDNTWNVLGKIGEQMINFYNEERNKLFKKQQRGIISYIRSRL